MKNECDPIYDDEINRLRIFARALKRIQLV